MKKLACILFAGCLFASCHDSEIRTDYHIAPYIQLEQNGERMLVEDVKAYAYYGDTTYWAVPSWDKAVDGIIVSKADADRTRTPDFTAVPDENGMLSLGPLTRVDLMLLVCHTVPESAGGVKMYAWRNATIAENISNISVNLTFRPWRTESRRIESRWTFISEREPEQPEEPEIPEQPETPEE